MNRVLLSNIGKTYRMGSVGVPALTDIDLEIHDNRFTVLSGPSGSGKTTLLNIIGGIDKPDHGVLKVAERDIGKMRDNELADFRTRNVGFVFQTFNLLPVLTAFENVEYPLTLAKVPKKVRRERVRALLDQVGIGERASHRPGELSGGQRQRVAIARALATRPKLVLADEPTANLDSATGDQIIALMRRMQREHRLCFIFSSHDPKVLAEADDVISIQDGRVVAVERRNKEVTV